MHLSVRELQQGDIARIADYWLLSPPAHMQAMGVDLSKLPERSGFEQMLAGQLALPVQQRRSYCLIWLADGEAVGHCNTNPTQYGGEAAMHLHLWQGGHRRQGMGIELVRLSLPWFFRELQLQTLYSEPYALNEAPNRTLAKAGFTLQKEYVTTPGSLNFEQPVKRWQMTREQFEELYPQ